MEKEMQGNIFNSDVDSILEEDGCTTFIISNETGEGIIRSYKVFPGIELLYNDFNMKDGFNLNKMPKPNVLEINHCRAGRFECEFKNGDCTYIGAGDMSVSMLSNETKSTAFPLSHYHGISITINSDEAKETINKISEVLGGITIDIDDIINNLCGKYGYVVIRGQKVIEHIFNELYVCSKEMIKGYFKIKVMELLMFLSSLKEGEYYKEQRYFYHHQVKKVKEIHKFIIDNINEHVTLDELSKKFNISLTTMKSCFKAVYGSSIYAYTINYKMQMAAVLLKESRDSITQIAGKAGYENPSKFSEAFKKNMGILPSQYRKLYSR